MVDSSNYIDDFCDVFGVGQSICFIVEVVIVMSFNFNKRNIEFEVVYNVFDNNPK